MITAFIATTYCTSEYIIYNDNNEPMGSEAQLTEQLYVAAAVVWNSLPTHLHSTSVSREQFRDGLKTHLFTQAYVFL